MLALRRQTHHLPRTNYLHKPSSFRYLSQSARLFNAISTTNNNDDKMKVLLTGGSGFIAAHCVDTLLRHGHSVVFTVRSDEKGEAILKNHPNTPHDQLSYCIVKDIAQHDAFDAAVISDPPFDAVLHTASPFHFNITDPKKDLLDPAIIGTTGILNSIHNSAPSVKRVIITSSFASILNPKQQSNITYSEDNWNPVTIAEADNDSATAYRASKAFAEKAAWDFVAEKKPAFSVSTICPPLVIGPVVHYFNSLDSINTSNQRTLNMMRGQMKEGIAASGVFIWVDVRDVADAHVFAMEKEEAAGKRFLVTAGYYSNAEIAQILKDEFPEYVDKLPEKLETDRPKDVYGYDNSRSKEVLGLKYRPLKGAIVDLVKSLKEAGA